MGNLTAGFSRVDVTPPMGIGMAGYYIPRFADGILDNLEINALALSGSGDALLISIDNVGVHAEEQADLRRHIAGATGLPIEAVFLSATHTHTGPYLRKRGESDEEREYYAFVYRRMADAARFALADRKPARMGWAAGRAPKVAFLRRFRMKDGSIRTNPGMGNPNIAEALGAVDESVSILRFDRENAETILLAHFANHPDVVGGCKLSADWPGFFRRTIEKTLDNVKSIFFNGASGDVNHVNVNASGGDLNDLAMDFDDVSRGYGHARHIGRVVAGAVLQVYDKVTYEDVNRIRAAQRPIRIPSNMPKPEELATARRYNALHAAGKDEEIPFRGMELTTVVAEAERMLSLENGPEAFDISLSGVAIGDVALVGIPGEPFSGVGRGIKEASGWQMILPCCLINGSEGYFPMMDAYEQGGYEARSSPFKAGAAELIVKEGKALLDTLRNRRIFAD